MSGHSLLLVSIIKQLPSNPDAGGSQISTFFRKFAELKKGSLLFSRNKQGQRGN
jgi:hypothetical protein